MGEYISITIGHHGFLSSKNCFDDLLLFFSPCDLHIEKDALEDDEGIKYEKRYFETSVAVAKQCLDSLGYTMQSVKEDFEKCKNEEVEFRTDYNIGSSELIDDYKNNFIFDAWVSAVKKYAICLATNANAHQIVEQDKNCPNLTISESVVLRCLPYSWDGAYWGLNTNYISHWSVFRVILEAFTPEQKICLDFTNLYEGGWCEEIPCDEDYYSPKTLILTEGSFDTEVIRESMTLLYPYMCKFYSFIDYSLVHVQGSTSSLTSYVKLFIGAGIKNRVIALYDNDTAGQEELARFTTIRVPANFRVLHLPRIKLAEEYPTIGPTSNERVDINGRACSIELFLGHDVLTNDCELIPVRWTGLNSKLNSYQGEISKKGIVQKKFRYKLKLAKELGISDLSCWTEMDCLLKTIFNAFN